MTHSVFSLINLPLQPGDRSRQANALAAIEEATGTNQKVAAR